MEAQYEWLMFKLFFCATFAGTFTGFMLCTLFWFAVYWFTIRPKNYTLCQHRPGGPRWEKHGY